MTGIAWSASEPWIFASLSYDGRVTINDVPSAEKCVLNCLLSTV